MSIAHFDELCRQFCETDGFPHPSLQYDDQGRLAFSVRHQGVSVTALEAHGVHGESAKLVAEFCSFPAGYELAGWQALMDANLMMMDADAPWFSRNQVTGNILLQWHCPLPELSARQVLDRMAQMAGMVAAWRDDGACRSADAAPATRCTFPRIDRSHRPWSVRGGRSQHAVAA